MSSALSYHVFRLPRLLVACVFTTTTTTSSYPGITPLPFVRRHRCTCGSVIFFNILYSTAGTVFGFNLRGSCPAHDHTHTHSRTNTLTRTHTYTQRPGRCAKVRFGNTNTAGQRISCAAVERDRGSCLTRSLYRLKLGKGLFAPYHRLPTANVLGRVHGPTRLLNINDKRKHAVTVQDSELILLLSVSGNVLLTSADKRGKTMTAATGK